MRSFDPRALDPAFRLAGFQDLEETADGVMPSRLPPAGRRQMDDLVLTWTASLPSGGRIEVVSDTSAIEVDLQLTRLAYARRDPLLAGIDLVVDGALVDGARVDEGHLLRLLDPRDLSQIEYEVGGRTTVRFEGIPDGEHHLEVWLPNSASTELLAVRVDDGASLTAPTVAPVRWVHYGSSISHCVEAERPTGVWPVLAARKAGVDLTSLAIAGQCQLDGFMARTIRDLDVDLISLKVGINIVNGDTYRERTFVPAVHGFLDTIRDGHPDTPIILVTPIICPAVEDEPGPTAFDEDAGCRRVPRSPELMEGALSLVRIRQLLAQAVDVRVADGDTNLHLVSGLDLFGADDVADLPDGLHPNSAGYARMGERFHALAFAPGGPFA